MNAFTANANVLDKNKNTTTMISGGAPNARAKLSRLPFLVAVLVTLLLLPGTHGQQMKKRTLKGKSANVVCDGLKKANEKLMEENEKLKNPCEDGKPFVLRTSNGNYCVSDAQRDNILPMLRSLPLSALSLSIELRS
jgi:hypothetical protein